MLKVINTRANLNVLASVHNIDSIMLYIVKNIKY